MQNNMTAMSAWHGSTHEDPTHIPQITMMATIKTS